ncbi:MAG: hypothetical protein RR728_00200 [Oscillospiraceae bacterium]
MANRKYSPYKIQNAATEIPSVAAFFLVAFLVVLLVVLWVVPIVLSFKTKKLPSYRQFYL